MILTETKCDCEEQSDEVIPGDCLSIPEARNDRRGVSGGLPLMYLVPESVKPGYTFPYISYLRPVILECVEAVEDFHPGGENAF